METMDTHFIQASSAMKTQFLTTLLLLLGFLFITSCHPGRHEKMQHQLETLSLHNQQDSVLTDDSLAQALADWFDDHGKPNEQVLAHYLLGRTHADRGEAPAAIAAYHDAIDRADTTAQDCDYYTMSSIYGQMAWLYHQQLLLSYEIEAHRKASHYNFLAGDTLYALYEKKMVAGVYILQNKVDSAAFVINDAMRQFREHGFTQDELQTSIMLLHLYRDNPDKLSETKQLIDRYDSLSESLSSGLELQSSMRKYYYYKGKYYEGINMLDSAEIYYRKVYRPGMSFVEYDPLYSGLLSVFKKQHNADSIAKYAELYCAVNDSSISIKDRETTAKMSASYNYSRYQKMALKSERKAHETMMTLVFVVFLVLALSAILYFWLKNYRNKQRLELERQKELQRKRQQEMEKLEAEFIDISDRYEKNRRALQLLEESHKEAINSVQQTLDGARSTIDELNKRYEANISLFRNENEILKQKIEELSSHKTIAALMEKSKRFEEEQTVKRIIEISDDPRLHIRKREWEDYIFTVGRYYPDFLSDLRETPDLTDQETYAAVLVLLNIRTDDIARLLNVSGQRVTNIKSNLNLSLFGVKSARPLFDNIKSRYGIFLLGK